MALPMPDSEFLKLVSEPLRLLTQLEQYNTVRSDLEREMALQRYWSDELAKPRNGHPKRLLRYGYKVYSQCDEDGIIEEIFKRVQAKSRRFVEFGVESGFECNTVKLLVEGWHGLWLDGSAAHVASINQTFKAFIDGGRLKIREAFITAENINELIRDGGVSGEIDLLSIDLDYNDYWVWKAIDVINPRVVVIEYNATLRPPLSLVVPYESTRTWDGTNYFGASLEALVRLGRTKGYRLVGCSISGANAFFVRDDVAADLFLDPPTAEEHYEPPRYFLAILKAGHRARPGVFVDV